jgi:hypothetical protein
MFTGAYPNPGSHRNASLVIFASKVRDVAVGMLQAKPEQLLALMNGDIAGLAVEIE